MLRSLFSGISGLRAHQQMMDITGNNIANVNTAGFKSSQAIFQDTLSQMVKSASAPQSNNGGTNPAQIGLGVQLGAITTNFAQGSAQVTGRTTDLMINGDGFFMVNKVGERLYTRSGAFSFDTEGRLVNPQGMVAQGWMAEDGVLDTNAPADGISLPMGTLFPPTETTKATFGGNLPADTTSTTPVQSSITVYDEQGNAKTLSTTYTKVNPTQWTVSISDGTTTVGPTTLNFAADGSTPAPVSVDFDYVTGGVTHTIEVDLSGVTSFAGQTTLAPLTQNGSSMGSLQAFTISQDGLLIGVFSNGLKQTLGQLALASFNNPPGLEKVGESMFRNTVNSGEPALGTAGTAGRGLLQGGSLEMSNVDLGQEFTNLIIAQRGFQANSKIISASDELLQDLVNLKR